MAVPREGGPLKAEEAPLDPNPPTRFAKYLAAIRYLEIHATDRETPARLALRTLLLDQAPRLRRMDGLSNSSENKCAIVGDGAGIWSFIHIHDAAGATVAAFWSGIQESTTLSTMNRLPSQPGSALAGAVGSNPPCRVPVWLGKLAIGEGGVSMMTQIRGGSNAKAKREFGWERASQTWRQVFVEGLG